MLEQHTDAESFLVLSVGKTAQRAPDKGFVPNSRLETLCKSEGVEFSDVAHPSFTLSTVGYSLK